MVVLLQLIIDNAQMSAEPDVIVPLAYFTPYQVILIGDEQQCAPVVLSERASRLGFDQSLFQRAISKACHLTQHYRMVSISNM